MLRMLGDSSDFASALPHPADADLLKGWRITSNDPFCSSDDAEFGSFLGGGGTRPDGFRWCDDGFDDCCVDWIIRFKRFDTQNCDEE